MTTQAHGTQLDGPFAERHRLVRRCVGGEDGIGRVDRGRLLPIAEIVMRFVDGCGKRLDRCAVDWNGLERSFAGSIALWGQL